MVSLGLIYGFFRVHLWFLSSSFRFSCRVSYQDVFRVSFWVSPRVPLGFHLGYKQNRIKQKKMKNKETVRQEAKKQRSRK